MIVKKGDRLQVHHSRSGTWYGIAERDFDTDKEEWYPIVLNQDDVRGKWFRGDNMPARNTLCTVKVLSHETKKVDHGK